MVWESLLQRDQCRLLLQLLLFCNLQIKRLVVKDRSQDQNFICPYWLPLFSWCKFWELLVLIISLILNTNCMTMHKSVRRNQISPVLQFVDLGQRTDCYQVFALSASRKPQPRQKLPELLGPGNESPAYKNKWGKNIRLKLCKQSTINIRTIIQPDT